MKKIIYSLILCLMLSGCFETFRKGTAGITEKEVKLDASSYKECPSFKELSDPNLLLEISLDNLAIGKQCALMQKNSVKLLKEFSNYKEPK